MSGARLLLTSESWSFGFTCLRLRYVIRHNVGHRPQATLKVKRLWVKCPHRCLYTTKVPGHEPMYGHANTSHIIGFHDHDHDAIDGR